MTRTARLPDGPIPVKTAREFIKARLGVYPEQDPSIVLWGGASWQREAEPRSRSRRGRPPETHMDEANAALLSNYPDLGPADLAILEALFAKDKNEPIRFPSGQNWQNRRDLALKMKGTVRKRAHQRLKRARAVLAKSRGSAGRDGQTFSHQGTCTLKAEQITPSEVEIRLRIELHTV